MFADKRECKMKLSLFFVFLIASLTLASEEFKSVAKEPLSFNNCEEKCSSNPEKNADLKICKTGCRLFSIVESFELGAFKQDLNKTLRNCNKDCANSFKHGNDVRACNFGCSGQVTFAKSRRNQLSVPLKDFFGPGFPGISVEHHEPFGGGGHSMFSGFPMDLSGMFGMFDRVRNHMNSMMSSTGPFSGKGTGKLVVIKSGPGYHEEKTYHFGPTSKDSSETVEERTLPKDQSLGNDMMFKPNPLDSFFRMITDNKGFNEGHDPNKDVEIFVPKELEKEKEKEQATKKKPMIFSVDFLSPLISNSRNQEELNAIQKQIQKDLNSNSVHGFDWLEAPKLPKHGLRPKETVCSKPSDTMKWSEWVGCLHKQMGLPCWVTAFTIGLGVIFMIWVCLVLPSNAPKQKLKGAAAKGKESKILVTTTKSEMALVAPPSYEKIDLPPAYDDLAFLHVAVPVHQNGENNGKENTEKKVPLEDA